MVNGNFIIDEMSKALLARMGRPSGQETKFTGLDISEMAAECVKMSGKSPQRGSAATLAQALLTSDFPALLANTVNRTVAEKYPKIHTAFEKITDKGRVADFRPGSVVRMLPGGIFEKFNPGAEIKHIGQVEEGSEATILETFGGIVSLDAHALLNDDLQLLSDTGAFLARTAKRTQNLEVMRYLLSNPTLSDGTALFATGRGNLLSGSASALSKDSLGLAMKTLRSMADDAGIPYGIEPAVLLVPPALEETAAELCHNIAEVGRERLTLVVEPLLELIALGGSSTAWYLFPDPEVSPVLRVMLLEGAHDKPYLAEKIGHSSDEIEFKGVFDFSVVAIGSRAVKSAGQ